MRGFVPTVYVFSSHIFKDVLFVWILFFFFEVLVNLIVGFYFISVSEPCNHVSICVFSEFLLICRYMKLANCLSLHMVFSIKSCTLDICLGLATC